MVQDRYKQKSSLRGRLFGFALLNILPIGGFGWVAWGVASGRFRFEDVLPEGIGRTAAFLGSALGLLFVVTTFLLPIVHAGVLYCRAALVKSVEVRSRGGFLRCAWEWILWPPRKMAHVVLYLARFVCYILSLGLIALVVVLTVRLINPGFLEDHVRIESWLSWVETWLSF